MTSLSTNAPLAPNARMPRRSRRGIGIAEILLGLGISAGILAAAVITYQNTQGQSDELTMDRALPQIVAGIRDTFPNARTFPDGDLIPTMSSTNKVPGEVVSAAADGTPTMTSPFGNNITVAGVGGAAVITVVGMDNEDCNNTLSNITDRNTSQTGFATVTAGGDALAQPFTAADVAAACDAGAGANDVVFTLR